MTDFYNQKNKEDLLVETQETYREEEELENNNSENMTMKTKARIRNRKDQKNQEMI